MTPTWPGSSWFRENYGKDPEALAKLDEVRFAYKIVGNPESRALYNAGLALESPPQKKWKPYLQEEGQSLQFWTNFAVTGIGFVLIGPWALLWRGAIWLGGRIGSFLSGRAKEGGGA